MNILLKSWEIHGLGLDWILIFGHNNTYTTGEHFYVNVLRHCVFAFETLNRDVCEALISCFMYKLVSFCLFFFRAS